MEQQTGSKQEKEYVKAVYCHRAYLTYKHHEKNINIQNDKAYVNIITTGVFRNIYPSCYNKKSRTSNQKYFKYNK